MAFEHPIEALKTAVASAMSDEGLTVTHVMGERGLEAHGAPPRYVWIPTDLRDRGESPTREVNEYRSLFVINALVEVHCWGTSYAQAWAMLTNLCKACNDQERADLDIENARHLRPGKAWNQLGEVIVVTLSAKVPLIDTYVDLDALPDVEPTTVLPTSISGVIEHAEDIDEDGEIALTVTTTP